MTTVHTDSRTLQWWRLELVDTASNHCKYYTVVNTGMGYVSFYGRLGAKPQIDNKSNGGNGAQILNSKRAKGYDDVAHGDVQIPAQWLEIIEGEKSPVQGSTLRALYDLTLGQDGGALGNYDPQRPLQDVIDQCRALVSEAVANPDSAAHNYAGIVGVIEGVREDIESIESYLDSLRLMLAK